MKFHRLCCVFGTAAFVPFIAGANACEPVTVAITSPAEGSIQRNQTSITAEFTTDPQSKTQCRIDNSAWWDCTTGWSTGLENGQHSISVRALDSTGSVLGQDTNAFSVDSPAVVVKTPTRWQTISSNCANLDFWTYLPQWYAGATDFRYKCSVNWGPTQDCTPQQSFCGLTDGHQLVYITALDASGNYVAYGMAPYSVETGAPGDTVAPVVSITDPANGAVYGSNELNVYLTTSETVAKTECSLDSGPWENCPQVIGNGVHTLHVRVTDWANLVGGAASTFTVDAPRVTISSPVNGAVTGSSIPIQFSASESASGGGSGAFSYSCLVDSTYPCFSGTTYSGLSKGSHTVTVWAFNDVGNKGTSSATFTVDGP